MEGVRVVGAGPRGLADEVPQKQKQNVRLAYTFFYIFLSKILDLMIIRKYILQTYNNLKIQWGGGVEL